MDNTSKLEKLYREMEDYQFNQLRREELTEDACVIYDKEANRRNIQEKKGAMTLLKLNAENKQLSKEEKEKAFFHNGFLYICNKDEKISIVNDDKICVYNIQGLPEFNNINIQYYLGVIEIPSDDDGKKRLIVTLLNAIKHTCNEDLEFSILNDINISNTIVWKTKYTFNNQKYLTLIVIKQFETSSIVLTLEVLEVEKVKLIENISYIFNNIRTYTGPGSLEIKVFLLSLIIVIPYFLIKNLLRLENKSLNIVPIIIYIVFRPIIRKKLENLYWKKIENNIFSS